MSAAACNGTAKGGTTISPSGVLTCEQAKPEKQGTANQERDGQLKRDPTLVMWKEQEKEATEQHVETNAHEPVQPVFERATD